MRRIQVKPNTDGDGSLLVVEPGEVSSFESFAQSFGLPDLPDGVRERVLMPVLDAAFQQDDGSDSRFSIFSLFQRVVLSPLYVGMLSLALVGLNVASDRLAPRFIEQRGFVAVTEETRESSLHDSSGALIKRGWLIDLRTVQSAYVHGKDPGASLRPTETEVAQ